MSLIIRALGAAVALAFPGVAPLAAQLPQSLKLAYVNTRDIIDQAPGTAQAQATLQREGAAMQDRVARMQDSLKAMFDAYQKAEATLTPAQKEQRQKALADKQAEYQRRAQEMDSQMTQRQNELMQPILDQIKLVLEDIRVEGGYTFVFDVASGAGIVAADKNLNLSDRVIAKLRTMPVPTVATRADDKGAQKTAGAPLSAPAGVARPGSQTAPFRPTLGATKIDTSKKAAAKADSVRPPKPDSAKADSMKAATKKPRGE